MSYPSNHPSEWELELLAEDALPPADQPSVLEHLAICSRCEAEVDSLRSLTDALGALPRFAPSAGFNEAVMARVIVTPQRAWILERIAHRLPATRSGWSLFSLWAFIPALAALAGVFWVGDQYPSLTFGSAFEWVLGNSRSVGWSLVTEAVVWVMDSPLPAWSNTFVLRLTQLGDGLLVTGAAALAIAIPLSVWTLMQLLRTPMENRSHV